MSLLLVQLLSCSAGALTQVTIDNTMPRLDVSGMIMDAHDHQTRWALDGHLLHSMHRSVVVQPQAKF
jgi:hypothetical protein